MAAHPQGTHKGCPYDTRCRFNRQLHQDLGNDKGATHPTILHEQGSHTGLPLRSDARQVSCICSDGPQELRSVPGSRAGRQNCSYEFVQDVCGHRVVGMAEGALGEPDGLFVTSQILDAIWTPG